MKKEIAVHVAGLLIGAGIGIIGLSIPVLTERKKRAQIKAEAEAEINAITRAGRYVMDGIKDGDYDGKPGQIMIDFEFVKMIERIDD